MIQAPLLSYCESKRFDDVVDILRSNDDDVATWIEVCANEQRGQNALHLVLQHNPPREVLDLLLMRMRQIYPSQNPVLSQDAGGLTPLHVAAARCCHVRLIERLIVVGGTGMCNTASIKDVQGRYPLHWACTNLTPAPSPRRTKQTTDPTGENLIRVVGCLVAAYPMAADAVDAVGLTPTAMARNSAFKIDRRITQQLQIAAKMSHIMQQSEHFEASECDDDELDVVKAAPCTPTKAGSQGTEPTEASSFGGRPVDVLSSECYQEDIDISSIGWICDDDLRFVFDSKQVEV